MLKLIDLIKSSDVELANYKIHCAIDNKRSNWRPLDAYFVGEFEAGQAQQSQPNFKCKHILSLINLSKSKRWLFVGVYSVDGVREVSQKRWSGFLYSLKRLHGLAHLEGRAIIDFDKKFRASYLVGKNFGEQLIVTAIREEKMSIGDFPGFNSVRLTFAMLQSIIRQDNPSWRAALANVAGVYVITDRETGYQYVGSAYGGMGLWQRWSTYVKTKHGGNKELRQLLHGKKSDYAQNFQFSLIEVCDINAADEYIISRESHWKDVLMTREFGYNAN